MHYIILDDNLTLVINNQRELNNMSDIKNQVLNIVKVIETGIDLEGNEVDIADYMQDVLDINYITQSDKSYKGARLLVAFGGPNIWIDTASKQVEGYWWSDNFTASYMNDALGLDDYCEEIFNC